MPDVRTLTAENFYRLRCAMLEQRLAHQEAAAMKELADRKVADIAKELDLPDGEKAVFDASALTITFG